MLNQPFKLMQIIKIQIVVILISLSLASSLFAQNPTFEMLQTYQEYRQRLEDDFIVITPDVELYGANIPAIDRRMDKGDNHYLKWSDANSNFNNYISMLVTEIELLKRNDMEYQNSLSALFYTLLAIERIDLYSEYNLRMTSDKKIFHEGDSIKAYVKYPADINGFLLRDDVSLGFWMNYYSHFNMDFGEMNKDMSGTSTYRSIFPVMKAMSQDNTIRMLEALRLMHHFMGKESIEGIQVNFINSLIPHYLMSQNILTKDSVDFQAWAEDISLRLIQNMHQPPEQAEMCFKPWNSIGRMAKNPFLSIISTRWYMTSPIRERIILEGAGNDMGILVNAYGLGELANYYSDSIDYHYEGSGHGFKKYIFHSAVYKELKLPLGAAIQLPIHWDDVLPRTLSNIANTNHKNSKIFLELRDKRPDHTYEYMIMTNYLMNKEQLCGIYYSGCDMWKEDSTFIADILLEAPPGGPFSDTTRENYSIHWSTSSRIIWPTDKPTKRAGDNYEYAGIDYLLLYNLYALTYADNAFYLSLNPVRKRDKTFNKYTGEGMQNNQKLFIHAPVIIQKKN